MHKVNRNYFKQIDSENKAYILGFFYADGYNSGTQASFTQLDQDRDILDQINKELDSDINISKKVYPRMCMYYGIFWKKTDGKIF